MQLVAMIEDMRPLKVLGTSTSFHAGAIELLRRFSDRDLTLTDAVGMRVMEDRGIGLCWSTDFHLGLTGVPLVIHQH